jgi:hypothetical protein
MNLLKFLKGINLSIIGGVFGLALGIILSVNTKVERNTAIIAGVVTTIAFMQLDELMQQNKIEKITGVLYKLKDDHELRHHIEKLVDLSLSIKAFGDSEYTTRYKTFLHMFQDQLSFIAEGRIRIEPHEEMLLAIEDLSRCNKKLHVSSWRDTVEYWRLPEGKAYVEATEQLIKEKGIEVIRIFILKQCELEEYKDILSEQKSKGIRVRVAIEENLPSECIEAYIIYDTQAVRTETLIRGYQKNAILSIDKNDIYRYVRKFAELQLRSDDLEYINFDQPENLIVSNK